MNIQQVVMTPDWAKGLLLNNDHNRKLRPHKVNEIVHDILSGRWMLNPQPIAIATNGLLLDGQHRLQAIVLANQSVPLMMATDCPPECFKTIDIGIVRTNGDFFKIEGIKNPNNISPVIRYVEFYKKIPHLIWNHSSLPLSKTEIHDLYMEQQSFYDMAIEFALRAYQRCRQVNPSILAALIALCENTELACEFAEHLGSGAGLKSTSPIYVWRQVLINGNVQRSRTHGMANSQLMMAGFIKSYNCWRQGIEMKRFNLPNIPPMPTIVDF